MYAIPAFVVRNLTATWVHHAFLLRSPTPGNRVGGLLKLLGPLHAPFAVRPPLPLPELRKLGPLPATKVERVKPAGVTTRIVAPFVLPALVATAGSRSFG